MQFPITMCIRDSLLTEDHDECCDPADGIENQQACGQFPVIPAFFRQKQVDDLVDDVFSQKQGTHGGGNKQDQTGLRGDPVDSSQCNRILTGSHMACHTNKEVQACGTTQDTNGQRYKADDKQQTHMVIGSGRLRIGILNGICRVYSHNHVVIAVVVWIRLFQLGRYGFQRRI